MGPEYLLQMFCKFRLLFGIIAYPWSLELHEAIDVHRPVDIVDTVIISLTANIALVTVLIVLFVPIFTICKLFERSYIVKFKLKLGKSSKELWHWNFEFQN